MNGQRKSFLRRTAAAVLALTMALSLASCGSSDKDKSGKMTVIVKSHDPYWDSVKYGSEDAAYELGYDISFLAPENEVDATQQISLIEKAISDKSKAIIIAPSDPTLLNETLDKATDKGIPVLVVDTDMDYEKKSCVLTTNQDAAGGIAARETMDRVPGGGEIACVSHTNGSLTSIGRFDGYFQNLPHTASCDIPEGYTDVAEGADADENADFDLVDIQFCENDADVAGEQTKTLVSEHPDLKVIFCTNQTSTIGVARAIDELGLKDKVSVIGFDSSDEEIDYVKEGVLDGIVVQNPYNMGYLGVRYADKMIDGESIPTGIDTGVTFVTSDNVDNEEVKILLNPEKY